MNYDFSNKTVLITGATRGIGKELANQLDSMSADLILTGTNNDEIERLNSLYSNRKYFVLDLESEDSINLFFSEIDKINKIDLCINNAGINIVEDFIDSKTENYDKILDINLKGPYLINKFIAKKMVLNNFGKIINVASIWSIKSKVGRSIYSISKNAIHGMTKSMAIELSKYNILVNTVSPGFTKTDLTMSTNSINEIKAIEDSIPLKRLAEPKEIAKAVIFLLSDKNTYISGQNIVVDGGFINE